MRKVLNVMVIVCFSLMVLANTGVVAEASVKQTETTKTLDVDSTKSVLVAYAAFDRVGSKMSNGLEWDYTGRATIKNAAKAGTLKLTITGQASLKTSASFSVGLVAKSASGSSSWQTISESYSQSKSITKKSTNQSTSDTSNLTVAPSKYYDSGTACITSTARLKWSSSSKWYKISAIA